MGCNIHAFVETKKKKSIIGGQEWKLLEVYPYKKEGEEDEHMDYGGHWYRNYVLYSYLADVRNYSDEKLAVVPERGIPSDASRLFKEIVKYWDCDGHSHSFLSLKELLKIPWNLKLDVGTKWEDTLKKASKKFWQEIILPMEVAEALGFETRVVFFFDN